MTLSAPLSVCHFRLPQAVGRCLLLIAKELNGSATMLVGLYYLAPGERHLLHHHPTEAEYYFVVEGEGLFTVGDEERRAGPGVAIMLPPGTPHAVANDGGRDLCILFGYDVGGADEVTMVWDE